MKGLLAAALSLLIAAPACAEDSCPLRVPGPVLQPKAYPGRTLHQQDSHMSIETVRPHPGLRVDIRQDGCADVVTTRFTLTIARGKERERTDDEWIDYARSEIARLKTSEPRRLEELDAFLAKAHDIRPRKGERASCNDGSAADAGACSWESLGGYIFSVKRSRSATTISVTEYVSA